MKKDYPVSLLCKEIEISPQSYYAYSRGDIGIRKKQDEDFKKEIIIIFDESRQTYGGQRIHDKLHKKDVSIGKERVFRLMKELELEARPHKRFVPTTTDSSHSNPIASNLLKNKKEITRLDDVWQSDITYIRTDEGWLYLAIVLDAYSRKIIGWAFSESLEADIVISALKMAILSRKKINSGIMFHSDRGVQYTSGAFKSILSEHKFVQSMSRKGNCYDNAKSESFFSTLKNEFVYRYDFETKQEARQGIFEWIEAFYNRQRIHSSLNYQSPIDFEYINN